MFEEITCACRDKVEPDNLPQVAEGWIFLTKSRDIQMENEIKLMLESLVSESLAQEHILFGNIHLGICWDQRMRFNG